MQINSPSLCTIPPPPTLNGNALRKFIFAQIPWIKEVYRKCTWCMPTQGLGELSVWWTGHWVSGRSRKDNLLFHKAGATSQERGAEKKFWWKYFVLCTYWLRGKNIFLISRRPYAYIGRRQQKWNEVRINWHRFTFFHWQETSPIRDSIMTSIRFENIKMIHWFHDFWNNFKSFFVHVNFFSHFEFPPSYNLTFMVLSLALNPALWSITLSSS